MAGVNKIILVGHLGGDPEMKVGSSGVAFTTFTMATSDSWVKDGQREERTEWHRIIAFGKLADICAKWLHKGKQIYLEGRIQTRSWEQDGVKHYTTEIVAGTMQMLGSRDGADRVSTTPKIKTETVDTGYEKPFSPDPVLDDIPFG